VCDEPSEINSSDDKVALFRYVAHTFCVWTNGYRLQCASDRHQWAHSMRVKMIVRIAQIW